MKRFFYGILAALAVIACETKPQEEQLSFSVTPSSVSFKASDSSAKLLNISTNGNWSVSATDNWIHLDKTSGTGNGAVTVTVDENGGEARQSSIRLQATKGSKELSSTVSVSQEESGNHPVVPSPAAFDGNKRASTTYQLLVYSFADSNGDGVGDFNGIASKLDYLDGLGVTALWLSPIHPSDSYHGYDVTDYYTVNPKFGTEDDFKNLISKAHEKGISIYIDYVLNHSGKGNAWFQQALSDPSSPYRDYYFFSSNPSADYKNFPMLKGTTYKAGEWKQATGGSPKLTVMETDEAVTEGDSNWNLYLWDDSGEKQPVKFVDRGDGSYYLVMDINGKLGILVRKYLNWDSGSKFGAQGGTTTIQAGSTVDLVAEGGDMWFTGNGRYKFELTNVSTETLYYMGCFSDWMPDLNYGDIADVENNACFQDLAASADKWIQMGVDGLRLDAVKHICGGIDSYNNSANRKFLKAWYEHCNATYQAAGHLDNIFMVGEMWDTSHNDEKYYYEGLTSCFEFAYWPLLYRAVNNGNAGNYVSSVSRFISEHKAVRPDAVTSFFMTNHDHSSQTGDGEVRAADDLGKDIVKEKQAAAMILTTPGKPFIYQGEELGYWGNSKGKGDEYLRAPIVWDAAAKDCAKAGVNNKVDNAMLTGSISVATQSADNNSLLNTYKAWSRLRNTYPALAEGEMTATTISGSGIASWYMTSGGERLLVIHNVAAGEKTVTVTDSMAKPVALLGTATTSGNELTLGAHSSVVFEL